MDNDVIVYFLVLFFAVVKVESLGLGKTLVSLGSAIGCLPDNTFSS